MGAVSTDYINCAEGREPSMFSLTMDDLENIGVPGKKLRSMNIEDLLRGVAAGEESQSLPSSSEQEDDEKNQCAEVKKSVEDVWRDIQRGAQAEANEGDFSLSGPQRTLGEMTLEEFLVKSGVVRGEGDSANGSFAGLIPNKREREDQPVAVPGSIDPRLMDRDSKRMRSNGSCAGVALPKFEDCVIPGLQGPTSPGCGGHLIPYGNGSVCVHNKPDDYVDKVAERRQRRMIKNRESAARSRARKQAYTAELEAEVTQLREENEKLKKQQVEDARWRKKALGILTALKRTPMPKVQKLRRTNSV